MRGRGLDAGSPWKVVADKRPLRSPWEASVYLDLTQQDILCDVLGPRESPVEAESTLLWFSGINKQKLYINRVKSKSGSGGVP